MGQFKPGNNRGGFSRGGGFDRGGRSGGFGRGGDRGGFGRRDSRGPARMFDAVCSNCKKPCQVPFKPTGSKPVFCSDCFRQESGHGRDERSFAPRSSERTFAAPGAQSGVSQKQIDQINAKLDKILAVLEDLEIADDSSDPTNELDALSEEDDAGDLDDEEPVA